jgi:hypothetical protein
MQPGPDFDDAVLGLALPAGVEAALREAGARRGEPAQAMAALMRAQRLAPDHPAVLIAFYRRHFYAQEWREARAVVRRAMVAGAAALALPALWREVPREPLPGARHDPRTRFYLFALKGYAYLSLRLGELREAGDALALLRTLDPQDCVGAALLEGVRRRALEAPDDEAAPLPYVQASGAAAWAQLA